MAPAALAITPLVQQHQGCSVLSFKGSHPRIKMATKPGRPGASHSSVQFAGLWAADSSLMGPHTLSTSAEEDSSFQVLLTTLSLLLSILPFCFHILFVSKLQPVGRTKSLAFPPTIFPAGRGEPPATPIPKESTPLPLALRPLTHTSN